MIGLIQRVSFASVRVDQQQVAAIDSGILLLLGVEKADTEVHAKRLAERIVNYRIFEDESGRMNHSLQDMQGGLLVVPQFTLAANTQKGLRPGFSSAAPPELGESLYQCFVAEARQLTGQVQTGIFGADMQVSLVNEGPATFVLQVND